MPPGPDILTALLLQISGGSFRFARLAYAAIFLSGLVVYAMFVHLMLRRFGLQGAAYAVLLFGPWALMQNLDRQPYSPFPLLAFTPLVLVQKSYASNKPWMLGVAMFVVFVSSLYLEYILLASVLWCWIMLWVTQIIRLDFRHLVLFLTMITLGVLAHLVQNAIYLGPEMFIRELTITLSNRATGNPTAEEVKAFFQSIGVANHGSRRPDFAVLLTQLTLQFHSAGTKYLGISLLFGLVWILASSLRLDFRQQALVFARGEQTALVWQFVRLWAWIAGACIMPNLMFPAFNQEVTLYGSRANLYFLNVGIVAVFGYLLARSWSTITAFLMRDWRALLPRALPNWRLGLPGRARRAAMSSIDRQVAHTGGVLDTNGHVIRRPSRLAGSSNAAVLLLRRLYGEASAWLKLAIVLWVVLVAVIGIVAAYSLAVAELPRGYALILLVIAAEIVAIGAFAFGFTQGTRPEQQSEPTPDLIAASMTDESQPSVATPADSLRSQVAPATPVVQEAPESSRPITPAPRQWRFSLAPLAGLVCSVIALTLVWLTASNVWTGLNIELAQVRSEHRQLRYRFLTDLEEFRGQLFLTNINVPTVGFFIQEAGYGVCGLQSVPEFADADASQCKVSFMRRQEYWLSQQPKYFFFFTTSDLFPGFADCLPSTTLVGQARGGDTCVSLMRQRLATRYPLVHSNPLFETYDLTEILPAAENQELGPPRSLRANPGSSSTIGLGWVDGDDETEYRIERRPSTSAIWEAVTTTPADTITYMNTNLTAQTRYLYRVRACNDDGCSPYAQASATTP